LTDSTTIFAIDTSSDFASLALHRDGRPWASQTLQTGEGFAHSIFSAIELFLNQAAVRLTDIDCFASASGPGSFTGIRVCLSIVKGLAAALNKPAIGISNLRALASLGRSPLRAPFIDAHRGDLYGALYDADLSLVYPEGVMSLAGWRKTLEAYDFEVISLSREFVWDSGLSHLDAPQALAPAIAQCAAKDGPEKWGDPALLDANYIRRSDG
jgi:tRNA threonylcarbamoyladenosine biosynthesis protein TsaB